MENDFNAKKEDEYYSKDLNNDDIYDFHALSLVPCLVQVHKNIVVWF